MKHLTVIVALLALATNVHAQADTPAAGDCADTVNEKSFSLNLGLQACPTYFFTNNPRSPYESRCGFSLQIPLLAQWQISPHWGLASGLRYDFNWNPLYYNVEPAADQGLQFLSTPTTSTQHSHLFCSYLGIPLHVNWYPWPKYRNDLWLTFDIFAAYAVNSHFIIKNHQVESAGDNLSISTQRQTVSSPLQPWKLELGLTVGTNRLGFIHGVRVFTNCLPSYIDPSTHNAYYTSGISVYF